MKYKVGDVLLLKGSNYSFDHCLVIITSIASRTLYYNIRQYPMLYHNVVDFYAEESWLTPMIDNKESLENIIDN